MASKTLPQTEIIRAIRTRQPFVVVVLDIPMKAHTHTFIYKCLQVEMFICMLRVWGFERVFMASV